MHFRDEHTFMFTAVNVRWFTRPINCCQSCIAKKKNSLGEPQNVNIDRRHQKQDCVIQRYILCISPVIHIYCMFALLENLKKNIERLVYATYVS
uniref:Uncharacterized protein n=1 Tax=Anguilla anguilla TaxID=7936 RepID=A0A0E9XNM3_ANGAN